MNILHTWIIFCTHLSSQTSCHFPHWLTTTTTTTTTTIIITIVSRVSALSSLPSLPSLPGLKRLLLNSSRSISLGLIYLRSTHSSILLLLCSSLSRQSYPWPWRPRWTGRRTSVLPVTGNPRRERTARKLAVWPTSRRPAPKPFRPRLLLRLPRGRRRAWAPVPASTFLRPSTLLPTSRRAWVTRRPASALLATLPLSLATSQIPCRKASQPRPAPARRPPQSEPSLLLLRGLRCRQYKPRRRRKGSFRIKLAVSSEATPAPSTRFGTGREGWPQRSLGASSPHRLRGKPSCPYDHTGCYHY